MSPMLYNSIQTHSLSHLKHRCTDKFGKLTLHYGKTLGIIHYFTDGYIAAF